ncbi:hypothetical protein [Terrabacter sp. BE26]|uniref:hypothetical protein n=1 Tax=Terrabacter sp. BE26 TaxID=2898152 RepID=UPI0035BE692C
MTDPTTTALAETLREHDSDLGATLLAADIMGRARRRRSVRRAVGVATALAVTTTVTAVVVSVLPGPTRGAPAPARTMPISTVPTRSASTSTPAREQDAAWTWVSRLPAGGEFSPIWLGPDAPAAHGRMTVTTKGRTHRLGNEPGRVLYVRSVGQPGWDTPQSFLVVGLLDSGDEVAWSLSEAGPAVRELWRGRHVVDALTVPGGVALLVGPGADHATGLAIFDAARGGRRTDVDLPTSRPTRPRLATWKNGQITVVDAQVPDAQEGAGAPVSRPATYDLASRSWTAGAPARWFGVAAADAGSYAPERTVVMLGAAGDSEVCAHWMDGTAVEPDEIACGASVEAHVSPGAERVLVLTHPAGTKGMRPLVLGLALGTASVALPVDEVSDALLWESGSTLVGRTVDPDTGDPVGFRIDLGKGQQNEQLPAPPPSGS